MSIKKESPEGLYSPFAARRADYSFWAAAALKRQEKGSGPGTAAIIRLDEARPAPAGKQFAPKP